MSLDRYAVIGNPIAHSRSPEIHTLFAQQTDQRLVYQRLLATPENFVATVCDFIAQGGRGLNVTVPFKLDAFRLAHESSERARLAGAVNTLIFRDGKILGDNTDGAGLVADLAGHLGLDLPGKKILLLGAGGAARGVILPLLHAGVAQITIANRTSEKAQQLAAIFSAQGTVSTCALDGIEADYDCIVNATSASLGGDCPALSGHGFHAGCLAYDMVYGKEATPFMRQALAQGARASDGFGMLVEQAVESFYLWRGIRPQTADVLTHLRKQIAA